MREIKFRAWDKKRTGAYNHIVYQNDEELWEYFRDLNDDERRYDCQFILMQFTGLKDKNGKDIYEGDVVKRDGYIESVKFEASYCDCDSHKLGYDYRISDSEIIGNIYENPNLLEK